MQLVGALPRRSVQVARIENATQVAASFKDWLIPSVVDLLFLACLLVALRLGSTMLSADGDPARHLVVGEYMLTTQLIPQVDVFSHTKKGEPFVPYEWLSEVGSAASYRLAGLAGPVLLHGAVIGLTFAIVMGHLRRRGHALLLALAVTLLTAAVSSIHWLARPHVFTFLGTAAFCAVLDGWRSGQLAHRSLWVLVPTMVVWANTHGGFLIGFILLGTYVGADLMRVVLGSTEAASPAQQRLRSLALPTAGVFGATLATPAGTELLGHVTGYFQKKLLVNRTLEYMSPDFHSPIALPFLVLLLGLAACMAWSRRQPSMEQGMLFLGFAYFALHSARNIPLFAIVVAPLLAEQLSMIPPVIHANPRVRRFIDGVLVWLSQRNAAYTRMDSRSRGHLWPVLVLTMLVAVGAAQHKQGEDSLNQQFDGRRQPVQAAAHLKQHVPGGNGFNELGWGGFLLHELWPVKNVFIDGQTDFYGEALAFDYLVVAELSAGWQDVLIKHDIRWVIYGTDTPLVRALSAMPDWRVQYQDDLATVLTRTTDPINGN